MGLIGKSSTYKIKGIHDKRNLSVDVDDMYKLERQILASFKSTQISNYLIVQYIGLDILYN